MTKDKPCIRCGKLTYSFKELCWDCEEEDKIEVIKQDVLSNGETSYEKYIVCPYCGEHYGEDDIHESDDFVCDKCDKEFHVEVDYDVSYSTNQID